MKAPSYFVGGRVGLWALLKRCLGAVAIVLAVPACETLQAPPHAKAILEQTHGEWTTQVLYTAAEARFRASTSYYGERNTVVVLNLDLVPGNCTNYVMTINIGIPAQAKRSFSSDYIYGQIRVDDKPLHDIQYAFSTEQGQPVVFVTFYEFSESGHLWRELIQGGSVRFKLAAGERNYYLNFALNGFSSAVTRIHKLCTDLQNNTYFP